MPGARHDTFSHNHLVRHRNRRLAREGIAETMAQPSECGDARAQANQASKVEALAGWYDGFISAWNGFAWPSDRWNKYSEEGTKARKTTSSSVRES